MEGVDCSARKYNWTTTQLKRTTCIADLKQNLHEENIIQRDYFCIGGKTGAGAVRKLGAAYPPAQAQPRTAPGDFQHGSISIPKLCLFQDSQNLTSNDLEIFIQIHQQLSSSPV